MPRSVHVAALAALSLLLPATASAAQRYAAPNGSGTSCTQAAPCPLGTAVTGAIAGDEVIVGPGDYGSPSQRRTDQLVSSSAGVDIHGAAGQPRPRIFASANYPLSVRGNGSRVSHLEIDNAGGSGYALWLGISPASRVTGDDLVIRSLAGSCFLTGKAVLKNSLCVADDSAVDAFTALDGPSDVSVINVTAIARNGYAITTGAVGDRSSTMKLINSIALGTKADVFIGDADDEAGAATLDITSSRVGKITQRGRDVSVTKTGVIDAQPVFDTATPNDYRPSAASPTVDAGLDTADAGSFALGGTARRVGATVDMGAYELSKAPTLTLGEVTGTSTTAAAGTSVPVTVNATVNPNGEATDYAFERLEEDGTSLVFGKVPVGGDPVAISQTYTVPVGTPVKVRVSAQNSRGEVSQEITILIKPTEKTDGGGATGGDGTATTGGDTTGGGTTGGTDAGGVAGDSGSGGGGSVQPPVVVAQAPALSKVSLSTKMPRVGRAAAVRFTLDRAATVAVRIERLTAGRRKGKRCVAGTTGKGRRCTKVTIVKTLRSDAKAGAGSVALTKALGTRPGRYRLTVSASADKLTSAAQTLGLTLKPKPKKKR